MTAPGERIERCGTCRFWAPDSSACHRRAPSVVPILPLTPQRQSETATLSPQASATWPITAENEWCGEWAPRSETQKQPEPASQEDSVAIRLFLARVAPGIATQNPNVLLESLLNQLPSDVRAVLVRTNGLDGRPPGGLKEVAREHKMSQGHVRALLATGEKLLTEVVRLLSPQRERQ